MGVSDAGRCMTLLIYTRPAAFLITYVKTGRLGMGSAMNPAILFCPEINALTKDRTAQCPYCYMGFNPDGTMNPFIQTVEGASVPSKQKSWYRHGLLEYMRHETIQHETT
jgi:hypothetical protein